MNVPGQIGVYTFLPDCRTANSSLHKCFLGCGPDSKCQQRDHTFVRGIRLDVDKKESDALFKYEDQNGNILDTAAMEIGFGESYKDLCEDAALCQCFSLYMNTLAPSDQVLQRFQHRGESGDTLGESRVTHCRRVGRSPRGESGDTLGESGDTLDHPSLRSECWACCWDVVQA